MELVLNLNRSVLIFTLAINIALALYIYLHNRQNEINRSFSFLLTSVAVWTLSFLMVLWSENFSLLLFFRRVAPASASLIAYYLVYFSFVFPVSKQSFVSFEKRIFFLPTLFFVVISLFSGLIIKDFIIMNPNEPYFGLPIFGPLYNFFAVYFIAYFVLGIANLIFKLTTLHGIERLQILYVLFGICVAGLCGLLVSLILPILGFSKLYSLGPPFTLITAFFVSYVIVRHRFLNIDDFLMKGIGLILIIELFIGTIFSVITQNFWFLVPFYISSLEIFASLFVLFQNWKSQINKSFAFLMLSTAIWTLAIFMRISAKNPTDVLFWSRISGASGALLPAFLVYFSTVFPKEEKIQIKNWFFMSLPTILFVFISFSGILVKKIVFISNKYILIFGPPFLFYTIYFVAYVLYAFYLLFKKSGKYSGVAQAQLRYVLVGFLLGFGLPLFANVVLPLVNISQLTVFGPISATIALAFFAYAIIRHRLMSIEIVIQKSFIYGIVSVCIMAIYAVAIVFSEQVLKNILGYSSIFITGVAAVIVAVISMPLVRFLQAVTDKILFRSRYDYQKTLREVSQKITTQIRLEDLAKFLVSTFANAMKISEVSFLILNKEKHKFASVPVDFYEGESKYKRIEIEENSHIAKWIFNSKDVLFIDELEDEISRQKSFSKEDEEYKKFLQLVAIKEEIDRIGGALWVPIISKNELIAILFLGQKLSGDTFTAEDIGLLMTLSSQVAIALENTKLYEEVLTIKNYNQDILDAMVSGVMTVDINGKVITFNPMAEQITGLLARDVILKNFREVFSSKSTIVNVIETTLQNRCFNNFETTLFSNDNRLIPVSLSSTILRNSHGRKTGVLVTIADLTEVKALEDKVRQADKIAALGTMAAGMAHEIKNPLSSMKVLSQLLPIKYSDIEFRDKFIDIMPKEISRIDRIVESLLGFARSTSPKFALIDLKEVIDENVKYFSEKASSSSVKIIAEYTNLPQIEADKDQMSQVFSNLILNAIQAMPEGGELKIITSEGKKIENILQGVQVEVSDTGYGISLENLKKLFDPFFTTKHSGTGLGLAISHSIIDSHRGSIVVKSEVGKGTSFILTLPLKQELL